MTSFPLYSSILSMVSSKDLTVNNKKEFLLNVSNMDNDGYATLYALIKTHYINNNESKNPNVPYNCKFDNGDVQFDLNDLPPQLRQILFEFSKRHMKKMTDDQKLELERNTSSMGES